jgi:hypothetical protein
VTTPAGVVTTSGAVRGRATVPEYWIDRGHPFIDRISAEHAESIFERVRHNRDAEVTGDLKEGFSYTSTLSGLLRITVRPVVEGTPPSPWGAH